MSLDSGCRAPNRRPIANRLHHLSQLCQLGRGELSDFFFEFGEAHTRKVTESWAAGNMAPLGTRAPALICANPLHRSTRWAASPSLRPPGRRWLSPFPLTMAQAGARDESPET